MDYCNRSTVDKNAVYTNSSSKPATLIMMVTLLAIIAISSLSFSYPGLSKSVSLHPAVVRNKRRDFIRMIGVFIIIVFFALFIFFFNQFAPSFGTVSSISPSANITYVPNLHLITPSVTTSGDLAFKLPVTDNGNATSSAPINVPVSNVNIAPTAVVTPVNQTVNASQRVTLDGSNSNDYKDGGTIASYSWVQTAGPPVTLQGANTAKASFAAPSSVNEDTSLTFALIVRDNHGATSTNPATTNVLVKDLNIAPIPKDVVLPSTTVNDSTNSKPIATTNNTTSTNIPSQAMSSSSSSSPLSSSTLSQSSQPQKQQQLPVQQQQQGNQSQQTLSSIYPYTYQGPPSSALYPFQLPQQQQQVQQQRVLPPASSASPLALPPPIAIAGASQIVDANTNVVLDGRNSFIPSVLQQQQPEQAISSNNRAIIAYQWTQLPIGIPVNITGANTPTPRFTAPMLPYDTTLAFSLRVVSNDGMVSSNSAVVYVMVKHYSGANSISSSGIQQQMIPPQQQQPQSFPLYPYPYIYSPNR
jgi:hypothetical protein